MPSRSRKLDVFGAHPREVFGQFLATADIFDRHGHGVGHGQGELEVVGVGHNRGIGGIEMDQSGHLAAASQRRADHAGGENLALTIAGAQAAVVHHVAGQHGLALAQHGGRQEVGHAMVAVLAKNCARRQFPNFRPAACPWKLAGNSSKAPASVCVPSAKTRQRQIGHRGDVGRFGQLEGQSAKLGRRAAHLRNAVVFFLHRAQGTLYARACG